MSKRKERVVAAPGRGGIQRVEVAGDADPAMLDILYEHVYGV